ncbi:MAG: basic secretory protein-like protein [Syntrophothermus sp.]
MKNKLIFLSVAALVISLSSCKKNSVEPEPVPVKTDTTAVTDTIWGKFQYPQTYFTNEDQQGNGKYFTLYISNPDSLEKVICLRVCKLLYKTPGEVVKVNKLGWIIRDMSGVAFTTGLGAANEKATVFSAQYLKGLIDSRTRAAVIKEITGVFTHETAHVFQSDNNYGEKNGWSAIEGIADCVRFLAGEDNISRRHKGGSWLDGYTTTGFFIAWLQEKKDPDFLYKFNKYVGQHPSDYTWDAACYKLLNKSVSDLWNEYQAAI